MFHKVTITFILNLALIFLVVLSETHLTGAPARSAALTEKQRKEAAKLRSELSAAFDKADEETVAEKGVIVQPGWTGKEDNEKKVDPNVVVTNEGLAEAKALRAEITKAVKQDSYVASVAATSAGDTAQVKKLQKELDEKQQGKGALASMLSSTGQQEPSDPEAAENAEHVGSSSDDSDAEQAKPNVIEASAALEPEIDIRKLQQLEVSKRRTKEELVLKSLEEDFNFDLGEDVREWEHINHAGQEYFIGRREIDLFIVRKDASKYEPGNTLTVGEPISYLETFSFWNLEQQQQEGVILVASQDKVLWYRGDQATGQIILYWEWVVGTTISGLTYFSKDSNRYLAISSNQSARTGHYALNIYQFELQSKEFWIAQRMQLQHPCGEVTILDTGRDIILAVPQNNTAAIYTFNPHATTGDHIRFQLRRTIEAEGIECVTGFQMGGRSYLGLGGLQPQILVYQQGDLVPKTILGNNFGLVELFFPIPARTYRDDMILLVQHRVDFGTHSLIVVETLIWDGEAFVASIPMPCHMGAHTVYGVSCMLDIQRDEGLKGAAVLRRGNEISVIVPRHNAESGLFRLNIELLAKNSELVDLQDIYAFLKDWVKEQDELVALAQAFLGMPAAAPEEVQPDLSSLESLKTPELMFTGDFGELRVNDYKWTDQDTATNLDHIMQAVEQLGYDLHHGRQRRELQTPEPSFGTLEFDVVEVEDLWVDQVNNEPFYIQNGQLQFPATLKVDSLEVESQVKSRLSRQALEEELKVVGDVQFEKINGIPWKELMENIVFRNASITLSNLAVEGAVVVEDRLTVDVLNSLNFPADYLWSSGDDVSIINAPKSFTGTLAANEIDTMGTINGVDPLDAISLSDEQDWHGLPTFTHLEISEKLELNGTTHGGNFKHLPTNPTLQEISNITAACNFEHLEVLGPILLQGHFDKEPLAPILEDIVQLPEDPVEEIFIPARKSFSSVTFPVDLQLGDQAVNHIPVAHFVTVHTKQSLNMTALEGYVYFNTLNITGAYDGVRIEDLLRDAVKIDEPQFNQHTKLNFVDVMDADLLQVDKTLNRVPIAEYQTIHEDLAMPTAQFEQLKAGVAHISNDLKGNGTLNGLHLNDFLQNRNWSDPMDTRNIFVEELVLTDGLVADKLQGIDAQFLLKFLEQVDDLPEMILSGKIQVGHIIVTGDVQVNKLNGHRFDDDVQLTAIWLNRPNFLSTRLEFVEPLVVQHDLIVAGDYNGQYLPGVIDDLVFRSPSRSPLILATKAFTRPVHVWNNTIVDAINGVPFRHIATKERIAKFEGALHVKGNLSVDELEVTGYMNEYPMSSLSSLMHYDKHLQAFVLVGEIPLSEQKQLVDLTVHDKLNEIAALQEFFDNLVYKKGICLLKGKKTFTGRVTIERGAYVRSLNGNNMLALLNNVVLLNAKEAVTVNAHIRFEGVVKADEVTVTDSLNTTNLNGCSLDEWLGDSLRVDRQQNITRLYAEPRSLEGNSLVVTTLNGMDLSQVVTLHTAQNLRGNLLFSELYLDGSIRVQGSINNVDIQQEYNNTLLRTGNQHVSTPLTLQSTTVLQQLRTNVPVNSDKDLQQVATLHEDLAFESPLFFQAVSTRNLETNDSVSGINFEKWYNNTLWLNERHEQRVTGNWSVRSLNVKSAPEASANNETWDDNPSFEFEAFMRSPREDASYGALCMKVAKLASKQQSRSYFVKHLEHSFDLDVLGSPETPIRQAFTLPNLLLINVGCVSYVLKWLSAAGRYEPISTFYSGAIEEVELVPRGLKDSPIKLISNAATPDSLNCSVAGLNLWTILPGNITQLRSFAQNAEAISIIASTDGWPPMLYTIAHNTVTALSVADEKSAHSWQLPPSGNNDSYRFVPLPTGSDILLTNGQHIVWLNDETATRQQRAQPPASRPLPEAKLMQTPAESVLKPNATITHRLSDSDFKQTIERILSALLFRLQLEVYVTQLNTPAADLYDEHLLPDFIVVMEELQRQSIYPPDTFTSVTGAQLQLPANRAQQLGARSVIIIWAAIVEIEELHSYLRSNDTHEHPVCACIASNLAVAVVDVLQLTLTGGAKGLAISAKDRELQLRALLQRLLNFQAELKTIISNLKGEIVAELPHEQSVDQVTVVFKETPLIAASAISTSPFRLYENAHLPGSGEGEILSLTVGDTAKPHSLLAVTVLQPTDLPAAGYQTAIHLYRDAIVGSLFQSIRAHKPRSLVTLRLRAETLLAFVEDCCLVRVFIYRGVQGFVEFAKFDTSTEVVKLLVANVPQTDGDMNYYLATVLAHKVHFYEVVVAGPKELMAPLDCA